VCIIEPDVFEDQRGHFLETYHREKYSRMGIKSDFVQENESLSRRGVLRGLHYQLQHPQSKLCRVIEGIVWDVIVDIRIGSPTFARWIGVELDSLSAHEIFIPKGFAHGFMVRSELARFVYKCDDFYFPGDEYGILWSDPGLAIEWGNRQPILNRRDAAFPPLSEVEETQLPRYSDAL